MGCCSAAPPPASNRLPSLALCTGPAAPDPVTSPAGASHQSKEKYWKGSHWEDSGPGVLRQLKQQLRAGECDIPQSPSPSACQSPESHSWQRQAASPKGVCGQRTTAQTDCTSMPRTAGHLPWHSPVPACIFSNQDSLPVPQVSMILEAQNSRCFAFAFSSACMHVQHSQLYFTLHYLHPASMHSKVQLASHLLLRSLTFQCLHVLFQHLGHLASPPRSRSSGT